MIDDDDLEDIEEIVDAPRTKRKKLMLFLIPVVVVIGISVGLYFALNSKNDSVDGEFNVIQYNKDSDEGATVFYDLPEITSDVKGNGITHKLRLKINIELSCVEDIRVIQVMT
ncbi:MAG: hypothetical protein IKA30_03045, partial [Alphaproteobacteria bacterium]|nr:hypothetical protein [Alphaproteobacteria bacterium]